MIKTPWINSKKLNSNLFLSTLQQSFDLNQLTNYGPVVQALEKYFSQEFGLLPDKSVIVVVNAAAGLSALVSGINMFNNRKLKYATQSYTFPCAAQGPLEESQIVDIDEHCSLDLNQVDQNVDGIIVTNLFGTVCDINKYVQWSQYNNKVLLFDNATVPFTNYQGINSVNYGNGCIISLHHTKPIGFGEGGLVIVDKKYESYVRKCINFGFEVIDGKIHWNKNGSNAKMSELSAAAIYSYIVSNKKNIYQHQTELYEKFAKMISVIPKVKLFPHCDDQIPFVSCFALIFEREITNDHLHQFELHNITARKYYTPLDNSLRSNDLFKHILCLPCHIDISEETIQSYIRIIHELLDDNL